MPPWHSLDPSVDGNAAVEWTAMVVGVWLFGCRGTDCNTLLSASGAWKQVSNPFVFPVDSVRTRRPSFTQTLSQCASLLTNVNDVRFDCHFLPIYLVPGGV